MKYIKFVPLYQRVGEGEMCNAIICYNNYKWIFHTSGKIDYRNRLRINLWLIIINIEWTSSTREPEPKQ